MAYLVALGRSCFARVAWGWFSLGVLVGVVALGVVWRNALKFRLYCVFLLWGCVYVGVGVSCQNRGKISPCGVGCGALVVCFSPCGLKFSPVWGVLAFVGVFVRLVCLSPCRAFFWVLGKIKKEAIARLFSWGVNCCDKASPKTRKQRTQ